MSLSCVSTQLNGCRHLLYAETQDTMRLWAYMHTGIVDGDHQEPIPFTSMAVDVELSWNDRAKWRLHCVTDETPLP